MHTADMPGVNHWWHWWLLRRGNGDRLGVFMIPRSCKMAISMWLRYAVLCCNVL